MLELGDEPYELRDLRAALAEHGFLPLHMSEWLLDQYDERGREVVNMIGEWHEKSEELERVRSELTRLAELIEQSSKDRESIEAAARSVC